MSREKLKRIWYEIGRVWCIAFCRMCFRFKAFGQENVPKEGAVILVSNHQSFLDPVFCGLFLKRQLSYLARDSLFKNPFFRRLIVSLNAIPVRRGQADLGAVRAVLGRLREGRAVLLFPEATRTADGKISEFKAGLSFLCRKAGCGIVPVLIDGAYESWPRHKKFFSLGKRIVVRYGRYISEEEAKKMSDEGLAEHLTGVLRQMQDEVRIECGRKPFVYTL